MDPILSDILLSYILSAIVSFSFYFVPPVLIIPALGVRARQKFRLVLWMYAALLFLISYLIYFFFFVDFLGIFIFPLIFTLIASSSLKKQLRQDGNNVDNPQPDINEKDPK